MLYALIFPAKIGGSHLAFFVKSLLSEKKDVETFRNQGLRRSDEYLSKLRNAAEQYPMFREVIQAILRYGVTIEQEAFYADIP